ncbi:MAG TPA: hypothetical protein VHN18_06160 [Micromonosporaceae bacterium]|nr:hypothetical protein [Micromonosporaceae bacterium]
MTSTAPLQSQDDHREAATEPSSDIEPSRWAAWRVRLRPVLPDLVICLLFVVVAGWLCHGLWPDPAGRVLALNPADQTLYEWFLANDARVLFGDIGLRTERLNAPDGVNLMANTTVIALGVLFSPVTLAFGAPTTFAILAAGNLAATAIAWYLLFARTLGAHRAAAAIGGAFCGFAPGMLSQTNSHLHMTAQWLVPAMVWMVVRLLRAADPEGRPGGVDRYRVVTSGVGLAWLVALQTFVGEEVLFLTALTLVVVTIGYAATRPRFAWRVLPGFAAGMLVAVTLGALTLTHPLWFQFAGPQGVSDGIFSPDYFSADLASWWAIAPLSLAGTAESARLTTGPAEYNTFLGWPLLLVVGATALWQIRRPLVVACLAAGLLMASLSLGPTVVVDGVRTGVTGPYVHLLGRPVVDGALPMRFALALIPLIATILVVAVDRALRSDRRPVRLLVPAAVVAALLPIAPTPLPTADRQPVSRYIADGHWRDCAPPGGVLVPVPLPTPNQPEAMRWATAADIGFGLPEGFFIGPYGRDDEASMGTYKQPTSKLLADVAKTGIVPDLGEDNRQQAQADLAFWNASCVVLPLDEPNADRLRTALEALLGPPAQVADVWAWRVR